MKTCHRQTLKLLDNIAFKETFSGDESGLNCAGL